MELSKYVIKKEHGEKLYLYNTKKNISISITKELIEKAKCERDIMREIKDFFKSEHFLPENNEIEDAVILFRTRRRENLKISIFAHADCNFRCKYCYERFEPHGITYDSKRIIEFVEKELKRGSYNNLNIDWFGGEPLLGFDKIIEISEDLQRLANKYDVEYTSSMTTNGYLLSRNYYNQLVEKAQVKVFQITIDGEAERHNQQRVLKGQGGTYDKIIENLNEIIKMPHSTNIIIRMNISECNYESIKRFLENDGKIFKADKRFMVVFRNVGDWGNGERENEYKVELCKNDMSYEMSCFAIELGYRCADVVFSTSNNNECYAQQENAYAIDTNGNILKCTVDLYSEHNHLGNICNHKVNLKKNIEKLWNNSYNFSLDCKDCSYVMICKDGFCKNKILNQKISKKEACEKTKIMLDNIFDLAARQNYVLYELS